MIALLVLQMASCRVPELATELIWRKLPTLSEQMAVAPPIVSQAASTRTKLLSFIIFFMLYAREMVTARGRPSGTATTTMVTPKMKKARGPSAMCCTGKPLYCTHHLHFSFPCTWNMGLSMQLELKFRLASRLKLPCKRGRRAWHRPFAVGCKHKGCKHILQTLVLGRTQYAVPAAGATWASPQLHTAKG